jgi:type IV pilus assembly protein PilP
MLSLLLAGCVDNELDDLHDYVKNSGNGLRGKIPPAPEIKLYQPFIYANDTNLPDPFKPRKLDNNASMMRGENEPDLNRPKEALEEFPLENLKMVGFVMKVKTPYAVVRAPDKKLYQVKIGNYVGMNFGKIQNISESEITLKEVVQDSSGDWSERSSTLKMVDKE